MVDRRSSCFPEFFADDPSDRIGADPLARPTEMLLQGLIDHRLLAPALGVGAISKRFEDVVVEVNGDARLSRRANHRTASAFREVVFLFILLSLLDTQNWRL